MDNKNKNLSNLSKEKVDGKNIKGGFGHLPTPNPVNADGSIDDPVDPHAPGELPGVPPPDGSQPPEGMHTPTGPKGPTPLPK